ncbi:hypothetical protein diail_3553 [Diaporthe ilicicola]|nr:hypothetical protein diail_3553 [Diaporthe ilicicola]
MTDKPNMPQLTPRELELLVYALRCSEGGFPKVDYQKFAEMAGFKNASSASVSFGTVKRKLMSDAGGAKPAPKKTTPKKAAATKRKQEPVKDDEDGDSDESPKKKTKIVIKKDAKKEKAPEKEEDGEDDEGTAFI